MGLQHTCPQQAAGEQGWLPEVEGNASASLQPVLLHVRMQWCRFVLLIRPQQNNTCMLRHTPCRVLGHTPRDQRSHWLCLAACLHPIKSPPNLCRDQHTTSSRAQHALGLTLLLSPLLQATSPAIPSPLLAASTPADLLLDTPVAPRSPKLAATPASYARSALSGLTVSQSTAMTTTIMPSWACAWLCCAFSRLQVPLRCQCSSPHWLPAMCASTDHRRSPLPLPWRPEQRAQQSSIQLWCTCRTSVWCLLRTAVGRLAATAQPVPAHQPA